MQIEWHPDDEALTAFVDTFVDSFCCWDVLVFYAYNRDAVDTPRGLAGRVGRPEDQVAEALERLAAEGVVEVADAFGERVYRLSGDDVFFATLKRFAERQHDPAVRANVLRHIISLDGG